MALKTLGKVFLNGNQFTNDPKIDVDWPARLTPFPGISGSHTVQDFGKFAKDMRLTLTSDGNYINAAFKKTIEDLAAVRGATYTYSDYMGLEGTVKIMSFSPKPTFIRDGSLVLYEYTLELKVMTLTKKDGVTYTGS
jgi:hypothetical protein